MSFFCDMMDEQSTMNLTSGGTIYAYIRLWEFEKA